MKKVNFLCMLIFSLFALIGVILFAEEQNVGNGYFKYYNSDGSLDWDTFYAKWDEVPGSYYMYLDYHTLDDIAEPMLFKSVGGLIALFDERRKNDIVFAREKGSSSLQLIFSPWNYTDAKENNWIPLGQKRYNFNDAIERWNFMLKNMK